MTTRTINCEIIGKMEKSGRKGAYLSVQIKEPGKGGAPDGGRFPATMNCWDPKQLEHVKAGDHVALILARERVKDDKQDDEDEKSYWWAISGVAERVEPSNSIDECSEEQHTNDGLQPAPERPLTNPEYIRATATGPHPNLVPPVDGPLKGHVENIAVRLYLAYRTNLTIYDEPDLYAIRLLRDKVYHQLINLPIEPEHYCYVHERPFNGNDAGKYGHRDEDSVTGWHMEDAPSGPESTREPTLEGE